MRYHSAAVQPLALVLYLHHTAPVARSPVDARAAEEQVVAPLVSAAEDHAHLRFTLHLSGGLVDHLDQHASDLLNRLLALVAAGRVEVVGGFWGGALYPALPERDAIGQVQAMLRWWRAHQDVRPRGVHLPCFAWDGGVARLLARLGLHYTVLEDQQFHPLVAADGYYLTEREGHTLALIPADTRLSQRLLARNLSGLLAALRARREAGVRCVTLAVPAERLAAGPDGDPASVWGPSGIVGGLARALVEEAPWIKPLTASALLDRQRPTDRVWPPPSITLPVAVASLGERGAEFKAVIHEAVHGTDPTLTRTLPFLRPGTWETLLGRDPELNRFHKRMLRASLEVLRLRNALREGRGERDPRFTHLEEATLALYAGQHAHAYVTGLPGDAHDAGLRAWCHAQLLRAEQLVTAALGESDRLRVEQSDYDCDGRAEVLVRTPYLSAIVAPSAGGTLAELASWQWGNFLNVRSRRDEPWLASLAHAASLPRLADGEGEDRPAIGDPRELPEWRLGDADLADAVVVDRHLRATLVDRFLGSDATRENVRLGRFPEAGDFVGAEYQVLQLETADPASAVLSMGRDGTVSEGAGVRLVRLIKRYVFQRDLPVVDVRYEVANRYHEPVRSRFAVELNLQLDGGPDTFLVAGGRRCGLDEAGEAVDAAELALVDARRGWRLLVQLQEPARLWYFPLETAAPFVDGIRRVFLGTSLLLWWPVELWGLERRRFDLSITLEG